MRQRFGELLKEATGKVNGQKFINRDGQIFPANYEALAALRGKVTTQPIRLITEDTYTRGPNSRMRGM